MQKIFTYLLLGLLLAPIQSLLAQDTYKLDNLHTSVRFKVQHLGIAYFSGGFDKFEGTLSYAPDKLKNSQLSFKVKINSVNTGNARRDQHLQKEDFFYAEKYPEMIFKSTGFKRKGKQLKVTGQLTIRGVTKETVFDVQDTGAKDIPNFGFRRGFTAKTTIKRSDFGVNYGVKKGLLGDEVTIEVFAEYIKNK